MMILSEIREERPLSFLPAIKVPFGLVAYVISNITVRSMVKHNA